VRVAEQIMFSFLLFVLEGDHNQARLHWLLVTWCQFNLQMGKQHHGGPQNVHELDFLNKWQILLFK
jgi:hypothetical protein